MRLQSFLTLLTSATPGTPARGGNGEEEGKVEKSWQGPGVGRGGGDRIGTMGRRLGGGNGEGKMGRGQREGGDGRVAEGRGRRRGKRRRHFTDGYDLMS